MKPAEMFSHWTQVRSDLLTTISKFKDDELAFTPFTGSWPVGQIMLHIADCEDNWIHGVVRHTLKPWVYYGFTDYPTREAILHLLERAHKQTITFLDSLDEPDLNRTFTIPEGSSFTLRWILWHVLEHEIHHRGELSLALGLLGREGLDV